MYAFRSYGILQLTSLVSGVSLVQPAVVKSKATNTTLILIGSSSSFSATRFRPAPSRSMLDGYRRCVGHYWPLQVIYFVVHPVARSLRISRGFCTPSPPPKYVMFIFY
jgi:hypothetical protein